MPALRLPSLTTLAVVAFVAYLANIAYVLHGVLYTEPCGAGPQCVSSALHAEPAPRLQLSVYTALEQSVRRVSSLHFALNIDPLDVHSSSHREVNVSLPVRTRNNGSLFAHVFVHRAGELPWQDEQAVHGVAMLTTHMVPRPDVVNLMTRNESAQAAPREDPVTHWRSQLTLSVMADAVSLDPRAVPAELMPYFTKSSRDKHHYLPILYVDELSNRIKDLVVVQSSVGTLPLSVHFSPISLSRLRLWLHMQHAIESLQQLGFTEKDVDEVKGIFADTNLYFLGLTFLVAAFHLLFDFLAFKNDISFWQSKRDMVGMSARVVLWRCFSTVVIFLFLMDERTSMLVLLPAGIGTFIEVWKVTKAFKLKLTWCGWLPRVEVGPSSASERKTDEFDSQAMRYLSYALYPLCAGGALYSLLYVSHKSWYSWVINSLVNGIYAFGFLFMLPQLFVNYKLKSVAHLPWRAFMYKAFNTFIDDIFAFIITMPTSHRLACFRDDIVFLIYLYQRWLYPVDKSRTNEFGVSYGEDDASGKPVPRQPSKAKHE